MARFSRRLVTDRALAARPRQTRGQLVQVVHRLPAVELGDKTVDEVEVACCGPDDNRVRG